MKMLQIESPFFALGSDFYDIVPPGEFKGLKLRWRNPELITRLGMDPGEVSDAELLRYFGAFDPLPGRRHPPLAQRYIGYQFRAFNPHLGDGRGFTLAQVRSPDGVLLDLGTKGSGTTPWSRGGDGQLTLKGGVREIIAAEFLHAVGIKTSRALTVIEHDAKLWRSDETSPTRASILVRVGEGHIRFGTFERIFYLQQDTEKRQALMTTLADHVIDTYYPILLEFPAGPDRYLALYQAVIERCAVLVAGWIKAGFCHGVLNTDNMSMTGDSFDYGPFRFMEAYDPEFTAAYFDEGGLYAFERQPDAVYWNLAMLGRAFAVIAPADALQSALERFPECYREALRAALLPRLGFEDRGSLECKALLVATLELLRESGCSYHGFFRALTDRVAAMGFDDGGPVLPEALCRVKGREAEAAETAWRQAWQKRLEIEPSDDRATTRMVARLQGSNPVHVPYRSGIERVWTAIERDDDWAPLYGWLEQLRHKTLA